MVTWATEDSFELGGTTFVCRPMHGRFASEPGRFCLLKLPENVSWYERLLQERAPKTIVEVGSYDGGSSALFVEVAHPKKLVTIDRRPEPTVALTEFIERRGVADVLRPHYGVDQGNTARLREIIAAEFGDDELDLVVDDASHLVDKTRATFNCLFPRLAVGGTYVVEDWAWAHNTFADAGVWADERPLSAFIFELILACGTQPSAIASVSVRWDHALVERGPEPIDPDSFDLAKCFGQRGAALIAD